VKQIKVTVLGSGCAWGTPKPGCECRTCLSGETRTRFGLLVDGTEKILVDAGPDFKQQMLREGFCTNELDALLLTHYHYDHISGIGEFRSWRETPLPVYSTQDVLNVTFHENWYRHLVREGFLELKPIQRFHPFTVGGTKITAIEVDHGFPINGWVLESNGKKVAVMTDSRNNYRKESLALVKGCNLLIADSWVAREEEARKAVHEVWGKGKPLSEFEWTGSVSLSHSLLPQAKELGERVGAKLTVAVHLTHTVAPQKELEEEFNSEKFLVGFDSMKIRV